jgi:hypothetical protein
MYVLVGRVMLRGSADRTAGLATPRLRLAALSSVDGQARADSFLRLARLCLAAAR